MDKGYKVTEHDIKKTRSNSSERGIRSKAEAFFYIFCYPRISTHLLIQWGGKIM